MRIGFLPRFAQFFHRKSLHRKHIVFVGPIGVPVKLFKINGPLNEFGHVGARIAGIILHGAGQIGDVGKGFEEFGSGYNLVDIIIGFAIMFPKDELKLLKPNLRQKLKGFIVISRSTCFIISIT